MCIAKEYTQTHNKKLKWGKSRKKRSEFKKREHPAIYATWARTHIRLCVCELYDCINELDDSLCITNRLKTVWKIVDFNSFINFHRFRMHNIFDSSIRRTWIGYKLKNHDIGSMQNWTIAFGWYRFIISRLPNRSWHRIIGTITKKSLS